DDRAACAEGDQSRCEHARRGGAVAHPTRHLLSAAPRDAHFQVINVIGPEMSVPLPETALSLTSVNALPLPSIPTELSDTVLRDATTVADPPLKLEPEIPAAPLLVTVLPSATSVAAP